MSSPTSGPPPPAAFWRRSSSAFCRASSVRSMFFSFSSMPISTSLMSETPLSSESRTAEVAGASSAGVSKSRSSSVLGASSCASGSSPLSSFMFRST